MAWNLNYPDYTQMGVGNPAQAAQSAGYGSYGNALAGGAQGAVAGSQAGPYGALIGGLAGTAVSAYGSYEQANETRRQYELAVKAWQADQDRQARLDSDTRNQQYLTDALATAQYGQGVKKDAASQYGTYAKANGL